MKVGVLGAGVMGAGSRRSPRRRGTRRSVTTSTPPRSARGEEHVTTGRYGFERGVERGKLTREDADAARARLSFTASFEEAANVDVVVEAVPEKLELKQQVFRDLDAAAPAGTILASNTSGFPIGQIAEVTQPPRARDRVALGVAARGDAPRRDRARPGDERRHRGRRSSSSPPRAARTRWSSTTRPTARGASSPTASTCAMIKEANACIDEGIATREQVDALMVDCFRWPVGPFGMVQGASSGWGQ